MIIKYEYPLTGRDKYTVLMDQLPAISVPDPLFLRKSSVQVRFKYGLSPEQVLYKARKTVV
jgi:hypothetical protein